jgi:uncharacterized YccA/Bax inhibitor family protein
MVCVRDRHDPHVTELRAGIVLATGALCLFYFLTILLSFFRFRCLFSSSLLGIGSACSWSGWRHLTCRLRLHRKASQSAAPKYMEWYGAFGLMVRIWLYLEILVC